MVFGRKGTLKKEGSKDNIFQFPLGIRWCSDAMYGLNQDPQGRENFNSPWELDGVRTTPASIW